MYFDPTDLVRYRWATRDLPPAGFDDSQTRELDERARRYRSWAHNHSVSHNAITLVVIGSLLVLDLAAAAWAGSRSSALEALAIITVAHGYLTYSATIYTMHEGAGHSMLVLGRSPRARWMNRALTNTCRLFFADPEYYASVHPAHHAQLATVDDGAYTHYVGLPRFLKSLLPLAGLLPFNDYLIHSDNSFSKSHVRSLVTGAVFHALVFALILPATGVLLGLVALLVTAPWVSFTLDRVRETYDHLFTPEHNRWGARSLGLGVSGMVIGGGPWGQPCHLSHHFSPGLPWYLQLRLHRDMRRLLRPDQRATFLTPRPTSFVRTYARNLRLMRTGARAEV